MRQGLIIALASFMSLSPLSATVLAGSWAAAPSSYVYRITTDNCLQKPSRRVQTGFRVRGLVGIVTALHGVVGCRTIIGQSGSEVFDNLTIVRVDIRHDVALLWSLPLAARSPDGFNAITSSTASDYAGVQVIGYPLGVARPRMTIDVKIIEKTQLVDLLPDKDLGAIAERSSPAIDIDVLSIQAPLAPGHSGAPLINHDRQVIGIGNGGLDLGRTDMVWAIPWSDIRWQVVSTKVPGPVSGDDVRRLKELEKIDPRLVFQIPTEEETPEPPSPTPLLPTPTDTSASSTATHTATPPPKNPCLGYIRTSQDSVQIRSVPEGAVSRLVNPGTAVIVTNWLEMQQTGKWYSITDENGVFLGWVQAANIGSLSPNCPKY